MKAQNLFTDMYPDLYPVEDLETPPEYEWYHPAHYQSYCLIADRIESDPTLLEVGLKNIAKWSAQSNDNMGMLERWEEMIRWAQRDPVGMARLLSFLRSDSEQSRHYKSFSPFAGILTSNDLEILRCSYPSSSTCRALF